MQQAIAQIYGDDEASAPVVSPEAEKVSVLQTVISPSRTTFYNKKKQQPWQQAIAQTEGDDEAAAAPVVSPEAEKVSVLQTVISPSRTTFYNKKQKKLQKQAIAQVDEQGQPMFGKHFKNQAVFQGNLYGNNPNPMNAPNNGQMNTQT